MFFEQQSTSYMHKVSAGEGMGVKSQIGQGDNMTVWRRGGVRIAVWGISTMVVGEGGSKTSVWRGVCQASRPWGVCVYSLHPHGHIWMTS